ARSACDAVLRVLHGDGSAHIAAQASRSDRVRPDRRAGELRGVRAHRRRVFPARGLARGEHLGGRETTTGSLVESTSAREGLGVGRHAVVSAWNSSATDLTERTDKSTDKTTKEMIFVRPAFSGV